MKRYLALLTGMFFLGLSHAQFYGTSAEYIKLGIQDANTLIKAYTHPANEILLANMYESPYEAFSNGGKLKFRIGINTIYLMAPSYARVYNLNDLDLKTVEAGDPDNAYAQTILGDSLKSVRIVSKKKDLLNRPLFSFDSPRGTGYGGVVLPYIHVSVLAGKNTNFHAGIIPLVKVPTTDLNVFMFKAGIQQNLLKWFSVLDKNRFDWTLNAVYGYFHGYEKLNIRPSGITVSGSLSGSHNGPYDNQRLLLNFQAFSLSTHIAYHLTSKINIFGGLGFGGGIAGIDLKGRYPVYESDPTGFFSVNAADIDDPLFIRDPSFQAFGEAGLSFNWKRFYLQLQGNPGKYYGGSVALSFQFL